MNGFELIFVGFIFELIIIVIFSILLILIFIRYLEKKHRLTLYLFLIFLFFAISIVFSWLSKTLRLYSGLDYLTNPAVADPGTLESWFFLRIVAFRFTFLFIIIGVFLTYILYVNLFEVNPSQIQKLFVYIFGGFTMIYLMVIYSKGNNLFEILAFLFTGIYLSAIYLPFMFRCIKTYRSVDEKMYKNAFLSLAIMSISTILILICQLIDRLLMIILDIPGYTIFYFLGWSFVIVATICAYLGYIRPKTN